jgi:hypothetical protein
VEHVFLAVPTSYLQLDPATSRNPAKIPPVELSRAMSAVPELYRLQLQGTPESEFRRMCDSPTSSHDEQLGTTYRPPQRGQIWSGPSVSSTVGRVPVLGQREILDPPWGERSAVVHCQPAVAKPFLVDLTRPEFAGPT